MRAGQTVRDIAHMRYVVHGFLGELVLVNYDDRFLFLPRKGLTVDDRFCDGSDGPVGTRKSGAR